MKIINDKCCGWINDLNPRINIKTINSDDECDWLIIGAGYTGLSAARKLYLFFKPWKNRIWFL